jgi:uncharacterized protein (TIGR02246 family)
MKKQAFIIIGLAVFVSCNQPGVDVKAEGEKLMQASREWSQAAGARNVEKTLSYWSDDATVISAGDATLKGKAAIRQMVEGSYKDPSFAISWKPQTVEISKSGDLGYLIEETKITTNDSTGKPITHNYRGVTIWKKQADGNWKDVVDVLSPLP